MSLVIFKLEREEKEKRKWKGIEKWILQGFFFLIKLNGILINANKFSVYIKNVNFPVIRKVILGKTILSLMF